LLPGFDDSVSADRAVSSGVVDVAIGAVGNDVWRISIRIGVNSSAALVVNIRIDIWSSIATIATDASAADATSASTTAADAATTYSAPTNLTATGTTVVVGPRAIVFATVNTASTCECGQFAVAACCRCQS